MVITDRQIQHLANTQDASIALYCSIAKALDSQFTASGGLARVASYEVGVNVELKADTAHIKPSLPMSDTKLTGISADIMRQTISDLREKELTLRGRKFVVRGNPTSFWVTPAPIPTDTRPVITAESA